MITFAEGATTEWSEGKARARDGERPGEERAKRTQSGETWEVSPIEHRLIHIKEGRCSDE